MTVTALQLAMLIAAMQARIQQLSFVMSDPSIENVFQTYQDLVLLSLPAYTNAPATYQTLLTTLQAYQTANATTITLSPALVNTLILAMQSRLTQLQQSIANPPVAFFFANFSDIFSTSQSMLDYANAVASYQTLIDALHAYIDVTVSLTGTALTSGSGTPAALASTSLSGATLTTGAGTVTG